jgi:sirohydrochlorin ferrochelatase
MPDSRDARVAEVETGQEGPIVVLVDNGSRRADSTLNLRRLAAALSQRAGLTVHPVSLLHSDRVPVERLDGEPAQVFPSFMTRHVEQGRRQFVILPLFFGPSRALTEFIPEQVALIEAEHGPIEVRQADVLCPLPGGEDRLADILFEHVQQIDRAIDRVLVVDHGSPIPQVTAVRRWLAEALRKRLAPTVEVDEAVMERREGREYDFNGPLLSEQLDGASGEIALAMLFLSPGRHAGAGGDIAEICAEAEASNGGLKVTASALVGEHPLLVDILYRRLEDVVDRRGASA